MPNPASTSNVMRVTLRDSPDGPRVKLTPNVLRIRKGTGPGRFDRITLDYPQSNQAAAKQLRESRDPAGTKRLPADGKIRFTLTEDTGMLNESSVNGSIAFDLAPGQQRTFALRPTIGIQPGGTFEIHPDPAIARVVTLNHEFPGVTAPELKLQRSTDGHHVDWHVEC